MSSLLERVRSAFTPDDAALERKLVRQAELGAHVEGQTQDVERVVEMDVAVLRASGRVLNDGTGVMGGKAVGVDRESREWHERS